MKKINDIWVEVDWQLFIKERNVCDMPINLHLININWSDYKKIYTDNNQDLSILNIARKSSYSDKKINNYIKGEGHFAYFY
jgi:hypothetical protein